MNDVVDKDDDYKVIMHKYVGSEFDTHTYEITFNQKLDGRFNEIENGLNEVIENTSTSVPDLDADLNEVVKINYDKVINIIDLIIIMGMIGAGVDTGVTFLVVGVMLIINVIKI